MNKIYLKQLIICGAPKNDMGGDDYSVDQVGLSIFKILLQVTRPKTVMLGNIPGTDIYRNLDHYEEAVKRPGFLILSIEAPINFANITYLNERLGFSFTNHVILSNVSMVDRFFFLCY